MPATLTITRVISESEVHRHISVFTIIFDRAEYAYIPAQEIMQKEPSGSVGNIVEWGE